MAYVVRLQKLLELYKYESARSPEHFSDPVYNANAHVLLHEDTCFRFESREEDGAFTVQLLDPDRSEVAPGGRRAAVRLNSCQLDSHAGYNSKRMSSRHLVQLARGPQSIRRCLRGAVT